MHVTKTVRLAGLIVAFGSCLAAACCTPWILRQTTDVSSPSPDVLLSVAKSYGQSARNAHWLRKDAANAKVLDDFQGYKEGIREDFNAKNFDELDKSERDARDGDRFTGGLLKSTGFYDGISSPAQVHPTDDDWSYHMTALKEWTTSRPQSEAARVVLAQAYVNYAWFARGSGYADSVSSGSWQLFNNHVAQAANTLIEAAKLDDRTPYWLEVMQQVATGQGWSRDQEKQLFDLAVTLDPHYYVYYWRHAFFILPKWYGEVGEAATFAEETESRMPGPEGRFLYFEIASVICQCDSEKELNGLSWQKVKDGYAALGQLYGYSNLTRNQFAHMAVAADDRNAARDAFLQIGDNWESGVWSSKQYFDQAKLWATSQ